MKTPCRLLSHLESLHPKHERSADPFGNACSAVLEAMVHLHDEAEPLTDEVLGASAHPPGREPCTEIPDADAQRPRKVTRYAATRTGSVGAVDRKGLHLIRAEQSLRCEQLCSADELANRSREIRCSEPDGIDAG
jgi:hypothetical protein